MIVIAVSSTLLQTGFFHMAAKGWINVQCQLHIKTTTRNKF